ncbi:MAG: hypothetical protein HYV03_06800 [Deltaproteobacteria bacterium]|nr:hypothetical protein [Deltaproteobacteria bacterium]
MSIKPVAILCMVGWLAVACHGTELYHDLTEEDANEILVLLTQNRIEAKKVKEVRQNQVTWTIEVDPKKIGDARSLLVEHNLPRRREAGLTGVYSKQGLIPTPDEQKARFLLALKGEIINSLESIPDVASAEVILNMPTAEEFASDKEESRPTASIVLKVRPTEQAMANLTEGKVQRFVANAVEKLDPRDVAVIITYTQVPSQGVMPGTTLVLPSDVTKPAAKATPPETGETVSIAGVSVRADSARRLKIYLGLFLGLLAVLALGLVATILQAVRLRRAGEGRTVEGAPALPPKGVPEAPRLGPGGGG